MHSNIKVFRAAALKWWFNLTPNKHRKILAKYFPWTEYSTWLQLGEVDTICLFYEHERFDEDKRPVKVQMLSSEYKHKISTWWLILPKETQITLMKKHGVQNPFWWSDVAFMYEREHGPMPSIMAEPVKESSIKQQIKPCDMPCPKCGSTDLCREFMRVDSKFCRNHISSDAEPYIKIVDSGSYVIVIKDFISHSCRCCRYKFTSSPYLPD